MKLTAIIALWCGSLLLSLGQTGDNATTSVRYTLLDGSYVVDDCLICGRPTIEQPLSGTFDLVPILDAGTVRQYAVRNLDFNAGPGPNGRVRITGGGTYQVFAEFAVLQDMQLTTKIEDDFTNQLAYFTNNTRTVQRPFPLIQIGLTQTNGRLIQTFSLQINAAPLRELWFSIRKPLTGTNALGQTNRIGAGDLVSSRGRVVKSNAELVGLLGVMPVVSDLGLDAVEVSRRGEILFSIPGDVFSETLGMIHHGDLLSNQGRIVKRNQELIAAFGVPAASADAGLDGVQYLRDGEILFSIRSNVVLNSGTTLHHGDILSDTGKVFRAQAQLLANFRPAVTNQDFGLGSFRVLPGGEIWFSLEQGFADSRLGQINPGDVLSDQGYRVFSNQQLVAAFGPLDTTLDYGVDALYAITDFSPPMPPAVFSGIHPESGQVRLDWQGDSAVFEVQRATNALGPWESCSPIVPDLSFEDPYTGTAGAQYFYRLQQW